MPAELAGALAGQPAGICIAYRRHASGPGRVVYRFDPAQLGPVSDACRRRMARGGGER